MGFNSGFKGLKYFLFSTHPEAFKRKQVLKKLDDNYCFWKMLSLFFDKKNLRDQALQYI